MSIEQAMIIGREDRAAIHLAAQESARERHPYDDGDIASFRLAEEKLRRALAEDVVDDLHRGDIRILDRLQRLFDFLDRDTVVANLSR